MRHQCVAGFFLLLASLFLSAENPASRSSSAESVASMSYSRLPLTFEPNEGQLPAEASFVSRGRGYSLLLAPDQILLSLRSRSSEQARETIAIAIEGANPDCQIYGIEELPGKANYLIGADSGRWRLGVPTFAKVKYADLYPGVDLVFYGTGDKLEYDLVVHPGADPSRIKFLLKGDASTEIEDNGALRFSTSLGTVRFQAPSIYQEIAGERKDVSGRFRLRTAANGRQELTFALDSYDYGRTLVIDPVLDYSTYLGGSADDWASAIAVDNAGNAYVAGTTASLDFPTTPGSVFKVHDACTGNCYDSFVAKINTTSRGLEYATYLGGSSDDFAMAIAVDSSGDAYVSGMTNSTDFPTTPTALQRSCGGTCFNHDGFVVKLNPAGSALVYSTYLGGNGEDAGTGIAVRNNNAYVSGFSNSTDFPVTAGAFKTAMQGQGSSFVVEMNADASAEVFGTFLGEVDLFDAGGSIALDAAGNSYVAGTTLSSNFPVTNGAFQTPFLSGLRSNLAVVKLNSTGTALVYSALVGGTGGGTGIAVDAAGNAYVAATAGAMSPVTPGAVDQSCTAGVSLLKFNPTGSNLLTAAHVCPDRMWPIGVAADASQNIVFGGYSDSPDLATTVGAFRTVKTNSCCFSDVVLGKLTADGSAVTYLTYFGGNSSNSPNGLAEDPAGNIFLAGFTSSTNFPIKNGFQSTYAGSMDAFVSEFTVPKVKLSVSPAALNFPTLGVGIASSVITVTVSNVSTSAITISSVLPSGDFGVSTNNCGTQLTAGAHCLIGVTFNPTLAGKRTGTLSISDGAGVQKVKLSGAGTNAAVALLSSGSQINTVSGVTSPPFPVTLTNVGDQTLNVTQISLTNGPSFNFTGTTNCFKPIAPLGSCTVNVDFGGSFGSNFATLSFTDNASGGTQSIGLTGNLLGGGLAFTAVGLRFSQQAVGTASAPQRVTLMNGTGATVTISSIKGSANFSQTHSCTATLAAGAYCYVNVTFKPTSTGIKQGTITVTDNATGSPHVLPVLGTGD